MTTELGEYFGGWRRRALLILLPAVAIVTTVVASAERATLYEASVDVVVPDAIGSSASSTSVYVANFRFSATSPGVTSVVAKETGLSASSFVDDIAVEQVGLAGVIRVTARHPDAGKAEELAQIVSRETVLSLLRPTVAAARVVVDRAQTRYNGTLARIDSFITANGPITPDLRADHESSVVLNLERQREAALAIGDFATVAIVDAQRVGALVRFRQAQAALRTFGPLSQDRDRAQTQLLEAEQDLADAQIGFEQARAREPSLIGPAVPESNLQEIAQAGLLAGAAGLVLAVGVVVALEQLRRRSLFRPAPAGEGAADDQVERPRDYEDRAATDARRDRVDATADGGRRRGGNGDRVPARADEEVRAPAHARRVQPLDRNN
jgi:hypothetical protein